MRKDWSSILVNESKIKENLLDSISKTGFPLEVKSSRIISKKGYQVSSSWFLEEDGTSRDIDLICKSFKTIKIAYGGLDFSHIQILFAECKALSNKLIIIFEMEENAQKSQLVRLPIFLNGASLQSFSFQDYMCLKECKNLFQIENCTRLISIVEPDKDGKISENKSFGNKQIYDGSLSLFSAIKFYSKRYFQSVERDYQIFYTSNQSFLKNKVGFIKGCLHFYSFLPILIVDCPIFKGKFNDGGELYNLEEVPYCIYFLAPQNLGKYPLLIKEGWTQAVLLCDVNHLTNLMDAIEKVNLKLVQNIKESINKNPHDLKMELETVVGTKTERILGSIEKLVKLSQ